MENILESAQKAGDNLEKDGTLTEEMKEKFPRPETEEDVSKLLLYTPTGFGSNPTSLLLIFLFGILLGYPGFGGPSLQEQLFLSNSQEINK